MKVNSLSDPHLLRGSTGDFYSLPVAGNASALLFADKASAESFADRFSHLNLEPVSLAKLQEEFKRND